MVRLLAMLMKDPLGYEKSPQYRKLKKEDDAAANTAAWPKDALKGMETNFLMNTILRIGSLMRVGFGSAGVDIISNNLERGRHKDVLFLNKQGSSVSCIFLFCDIRQFTDATECLQEEVFVFTNKIAAVVHSICHSYGGSANKNIGDAFLLSWLLDDAPPEKEEDEDPFSSYSNNNLNSGSGLYALDHQADKALLSVVKISMAMDWVIGSHVSSQAPALAAVLLGDTESEDGAQGGGVALSPSAVGAVVLGVASALARPSGSGSVLWPVARAPCHAWGA